MDTFKAFTLKITNFYCYKVIYVYCKYIFYKVYILEKLYTLIYIVNFVCVSLIKNKA